VDLDGSDLYDARPHRLVFVRDQWEIGHAVHALMFGLGFGALVAALLAEMPP
jgi:hypothetical protein